MLRTLSGSSQLMEITSRREGVGISTSEIGAEILSTIARLRIRHKMRPPDDIVLTSVSDA